MAQLSRISLLDSRLANQIAAGEVVDRPSSVVKELLENSIDAGAKRIEVDIERGGTRLIRITDDGSGVHKDDLPLALTRHATSKIHRSEDLAEIITLGFRGEALASISSVSRLTLTSRTADCEMAWQAIAQGRDMAVEVLPAAAPKGTRLEVADLFFNTPARQKFLRAEKTEFNHIEEVVKRHALANFDIAFVLKHNFKVVKRIPACGEKSQWPKRIAAICGKGFADNMLPFECQHSAVTLNGWLGAPDFHRSESDIQYVFINGRPVKDKTLNHAIRQAYSGLLPQGRMAAYVIFLQLDPRKVDVNVHPTKHEVRFNEQRLIHDILAKSINDVLQEAVSKSQAHLAFDGQQGNLRQEANVSEPSTIRNELSNNNYQSQKNNFHSKENNYQHKYSQDAVRASSEFLATANIATSQYKRQTEASVKNPYQVIEEPFVTPILQETSRLLESNLWQLDENLFLIQHEGEAQLLSVSHLLQDYLQSLLEGELDAPKKPLLFPAELTLPQAVLEDFDNHQRLKFLGFDFEVLGAADDNNGLLSIKQIPLWLQHLDNKTIFNKITLWLNRLVDFQVAEASSDSITALAKQFTPLNLTQVNSLIALMGERLVASSAIKPLPIDLLKQEFNTQPSCDIDVENNKNSLRQEKTYD